MGYEHPSHPKHALVICAKTDYEHAQCKACEAMCTGMTYGCKECDYFIDYTCLRLPQEVSHPSHPSHPLKLNPQPFPFTCATCLARRNSFLFRCHNLACHFAVDVRCTFPLPRINLRGHCHLLHFFDQVKKKPRIRCQFASPCQFIFNLRMNSRSCVRVGWSGGGRASSVWRLRPTLPIVCSVLPGGGLPFYHALAVRLLLVPVQAPV